MLSLVRQERSWGSARGLGLLVAGLLCVLAAWVPSAHGATYVFTPVADSFTHANNPSTNYGSSSALRTDSSPLLRSFLRFDVRGLDAPVSKATLQLDATDAVTSALELRPVSSTTWGERAITHANAPVPGAPVATRPGGASGDPVPLDATSLVGGDGLVSMAVTSPSSTARQFAAREVSAGSPRLVVETASPEYPLVAAAGDIACDPASTAFKNGAGTTKACAQMRTSDLMRGRPLSAVLPVGDTQYPGGELSKINQSYAPSWGRFKAITRPVLGDHEYETPGAAGYFDYFNGPGVFDGPAGRRDRGYYSYDIGNWHVIALNSNCDFVPGGCEEGSPQNDWLEADLAANPRSCTLAYFGNPRFTSGPHYDETHLAEDFWPDLYSAGVDVVLNGNDHLYERFGRQDPAGAPDPAAGIREFIVGTGGKSHYSTFAVAPNSGVRDSTSFGLLELRLGPDRYWWRFVPESRAGFTDAGSDSCTGPTVDTQAPSRPADLRAGTSVGRVDLSWSASTDNDGVARYHVLRDGVKVGESQTLEFTDEAATAGQTHSYRVVAVDGTGNESEASAPVSVSVPGGSVFRFRPTDDAIVTAATPTRNLGGYSQLWTDTSPVEHSLLRFDVSGLGTRTVRDVHLELDVLNTSPAGGSVYRSGSGWQERTVTWLTAPPAEGSALGTFGPVNAGTRARVDLGPAIGGNGIFSFRLVGGDSDGADYASDENTAALHPELIVETN